MATLDVGPDAIDRGGSWGAGYTALCLDNPCNDDGNITTVKVWAVVNISGFKVGSFYGSAPNYQKRDSTTIGDVTAGSLQTFNGLSISFETDDLIGNYFSGGNLEWTSAGEGGLYYKLGDQFEAGSQTYTLAAGDALSTYGEGSTETAHDFGCIV